MFAKNNSIKKRIISLILSVCLTFSLVVISTVSSVWAESTVVGENGQLKVVGTQLCNQNGQPIQLRGMSSHGLHWYGQFINYNSIKWLRDDWGIKVIRLSMYTGEGGYLTNPSIKNKVLEGAKAALDLGLYFIIDWHQLSDNNPYTNKEQAKAFFKEMSSLYGQYPNVIYEICNEPNGDGVTWANSIKPYANEVIPVIRQNDPDGIILVGTSFWSQNVNEPADDPLPFNNVMYVVHFYAGSHGQYLRDKIDYALGKGAPVFISEWGTTQASGDEGVYIPETQTWLDFLDQREISYVNWNIADKQEDSAILVPGASTTGGWTEAQLKTSGKFVRNMLRSHAFPSTTVTPTTTNTPTPTYTPTATGYKVSGYIAPDLISTSDVKSGFKVEVSGKALSATTDSNGYFEIKSVPSSTMGYTLNISKGNYLYREIKDVTVISNKQIGTLALPVDLWAGDVTQDSVINMADVMEVSKYFNSVLGDSKYNAAVDFNKDNAVNMSDIMIIVKHFNKLPADYPVVAAITETPTPVVSTKNTPTSTPTATPTPNSGYPQWSPNGIQYTPGDKISYSGINYECISAHSSNVAWTPSVTTDILWKKI